VRSNPEGIPVHAHEVNIGDEREPADLAGTELPFVLTNPGDVAADLR
jgi:hypothetical protein